MKTSFFDSLLFFQWGCMLASGIFSIRLTGNRIIPHYMSNFYWYSFVAAVTASVDFLHLHFGIITDKVFFIFDGILSLFHFSFLALFVYNILPNKRNVKYAKLLFFAFLVLMSFCLLIKTLYFSIVPTLSSLGLVLFCCIYYLQLFKEMPTINLLKEPSFWIINGIFSCMCITIPLYSFWGFLSNNLPKELLGFLGGIGAFAYGAMHIFFIKAYLLCSIRVQKDPVLNHVLKIE